MTLISKCLELKDQGLGCMIRAYQTLLKLRGNAEVAENEFTRISENFSKQQECTKISKDLPKWKVLLMFLKEPTQ